MLLAELTDGGTFHQQSQHFLKMWVCGSGGVSRLLLAPTGQPLTSRAGCHIRVQLLWRDARLVSVTVWCGCLLHLWGVP